MWGTDMSRGVNKAIIIGHVGQDPDLRYTPAGSAVANFNVATDESYKDKNTGQMVPKTEWHRVVMFGKLAEIAGQYLKKGSKVYIEGKLQTREWEKDGIKRYTTEINANEMQMLDGRPESHGGQSRSAEPAEDQQPQGQSAPAPGPMMDPDDDVPFDFYERGSVA